MTRVPRSILREDLMLEARSERRHDGIIPDEIMNNGPNAIQKKLAPEISNFVRARRIQEQETR